MSQFARVGGGGARVAVAVSRREDYCSKGILYCTMVLYEYIPRGTCDHTSTVLVAKNGLAAQVARVLIDRLLPAVQHVIGYPCSLHPSLNTAT